MLRATKILASHGEHSSAGDVVLDYEGRFRRRIVLHTREGMAFLLDLEHAVLLADGDLLLLDDGRTVTVRAADEALLAIDAENPQALLRIAWHLGNRHLPTMIEDERILIRHDHVIADMLRGLGAVVTSLHGPFTPERGAYAARATGHHHHDH